MASRAAVLGGQQDITDSERRRCREASGGPGQHSAAARLCGEGVWSLETLPQDQHKGGASPITSANRTGACQEPAGPTGARSTKAQVISL